MRANYWPTAEQELLLKSALLPGDRGLAAWRRVEATLDPERLGPASRALLPLMYGNLVALEVTGPRLGPLKAEYLVTWRENQRLLHHISPVVQALEQAGIPPIVLKGLAVGARYYRDLGLRPMADADILVPGAAVERATGVLRRLGWKPWYRLTPGFLHVKHAAGFSDEDGCRCDLHWRVFEEAGPGAADDALRAAATTICFEGTIFRTLAPTDQLFHVCAHAARWAPVPGIRWVADAVLILRDGPVDWGRLTEQSVQRQFVLRMRKMLCYLRDVIGVDIPAAALTGLEARSVSILERLEYRIRSREHRLLGELPTYLFNCFRGERRPLVALPRYLQQAWDLGSLKQVPPGLLGRAMRRTRMVLDARARRRLVAAAPQEARNSERLTNPCHLALIRCDGSNQYGVQQASESSRCMSAGGAVVVFGEPESITGALTQIEGLNPRWIRMRNADGQSGIAIAASMADDNTWPVDYQDAWVHGQCKSKGQRDCETRWLAVRDFCAQYKRPFTVLDIGANRGYFCVRLAEAFDCVAVAIEQNAGPISEVFIANQSRCILLSRKFSLDDLKMLSTVEHFDVVLALSVAHHFDGELKEVVAAMKALGQHLLLELPVEPNACGRKYAPQYIEEIVSGGRVLGASRSHIDPKFSRSIVHLDGASKGPTRKSIGCPSNGLALTLDSGFDVKRVRFGHQPDAPRNSIAGINLETFLHFNRGRKSTWPARQDILAGVFEKLRSQNRPDISTANVVLEGNRCHLIDGEHPGRTGPHYNAAMESLVLMAKIMTP